MRYLLLLVAALAMAADKPKPPKLTPYQCAQLQRFEEMQRAENRGRGETENIAEIPGCEVGKAKPKAKIQPKK